MTSVNAKLSRVSDTVDGAGATVEPLALADAVNYLKLDVDDDNSLVADMITSARMQCETINNRSFVTTTWDLTLDYFPYGGSGYLGALAGGFPGYGGMGFGSPFDLDVSAGAIQLPMPPLIAVTSIGYVDSSGTLRTVDPTPSAGNVVVSPGTPGRIVPAYGSSFPWTRPTTGAVVIRFTAGYGADPKLVPRNVVMAIRLLVGLYYQLGSTFEDVPPAVHRILDATRWGAY